MLKKSSVNQSGFAHWHLVLVVLVIAAVAFVGGNVYNAQKQRMEEARRAEIAAQEQQKAELAIKTEEATKDKAIEIPPVAEQKTTVTVPTASAPKPAPTPVEKKPEPKLIYVTIQAGASVGADDVTLTANLPGTYSGYCKALVKFPSGENQLWFDANFGPANTCSITVPKSKLSGSATWKYYMYMKSSDGLTKGESSAGEFTL